MTSIVFWHYTVLRRESTYFNIQWRKFSKFLSLSYVTFFENLLVWENVDFEYLVVCELIILQRFYKYILLEWIWSMKRYKYNIFYYIRSLNVLLTHFSDGTDIKTEYREKIILIINKIMNIVSPLKLCDIDLKEVSSPCGIKHANLTYPFILHLDSYIKNSFRKTEQNTRTKVTRK